MYIFELRIRDMRVDLSGRDTRMPEHFLNTSEISSCSEKSCCEAMSECMCWNIFKYLCTQSMTFYHTSDKKTWETNLIIFENINVFFSGIMTNKKRGEVIVSCAQVFLNQCCSMLSEIHYTNLSSFSSHSKFSSIKIDIIFIEVCQLRNT